METAFIVFAVIVAILFAGLLIISAAIVCILCGHTLATRTVRATADRIMARPLRVVFVDPDEEDDCGCEDCQSAIVKSNIDKCFLEQEGLPSFLDPSEN